MTEDPITGKDSDNPYLKEWYADKSWRAAGFKVLTTLWVAEAAGGPYKYISTKPNDGGLDLEPTHFNMYLSDDVFEAAGRLLSETLDHFNVPEREKGEVLAAFQAHKDEVISGTKK